MNVTVSLSWTVMTGGCPSPSLTSCRRLDWRIVREVLAGHHFQAELAIDRWHLVQQAWEDPDVPMPRSDAERRADTNG